MTIVGLACYGRESASVLLCNGKIVSAAQEAIFTRRKGSSELPKNSINFCLQSQNLTILDVDCLVFHEKPFLKFERVLTSYIRSYPFALRSFLHTVPSWLERKLSLPVELEKVLAYEGETLFVNHHLCHASSAFFLSPFEESAIIVADDVGEWATISLAIGRGNRVDILQELRYPDSLGLVLSAITAYLGFEPFKEEGKLIALASLGEPEFSDNFSELIESREDGSFRVDESYFEFYKGKCLCSEKFISRFGRARALGEEPDQRTRNFSASIQKIIEETILRISQRFYKSSGLTRLCLGGELFANPLLNTRILRDSPFNEVFVEPLSGEASSALGSALYTYHCIQERPERIDFTPFLGPSYSDAQIKRCLVNNRAEFKELGEEELTRYVARKLAGGKVVGWFRGRMEFGENSLAHRSILFSPAIPDAVSAVNSQVKKRQRFVPPVCTVLREEADKFFLSCPDSPYMNFVARLRDEKKSLAPAIENLPSIRIRTLESKDDQLLYRLIREFVLPGAPPFLLHTSFNISGEPMVCSPEDACQVFSQTGIDVLVLERYVIEKPDSQHPST